MDLAHPGNHLPLLQFKNGDEGVEELSPWKALSEIWQEPPPAYRIHIFVTFTNRESRPLCNRVSRFPSLSFSPPTKYLNGVATLWNDQLLVHSGNLLMRLYSSLRDRRTSENFRSSLPCVLQILVGRPRRTTAACTGLRLEVFVKEAY